MFLHVSVSHSVHRGDLAHCMLGYPPKPEAGIPFPLDQTPPWTRHPPGQGTPLHSACWEIQATSGQYASYRNAILSTNSFTNAAFIEMTHCKAGTRESHQHGWGNFVETALTLGSLFLSWIDYLCKNWFVDIWPIHSQCEHQLEWKG